MKPDISLHKIDAKLGRRRRMGILPRAIWEKASRPTGGTVKPGSEPAADQNGWPRYPGGYRASQSAFRKAARYLPPRPSCCRCPGLNWNPDADVTDVVLTHLHFDHAGGIITGFGDHDALTFPKARHWIQRQEWETAKNPDGLNRASYDFPRQLALLEERGRQQLIDGSEEIAPGVTLVKTGGHTCGSQIVEIDSAHGYFIYAGDIMPTLFHVSPAVTSAYDVCREDTFKAKQYISARLKEKNGTLLLNHDPRHWELPASTLK